MKPEPRGSSAAIGDDPQRLNLYSYVRNDPINFLDPVGLDLIYAPSSCVWDPGEERYACDGVYFETDGGGQRPGKPTGPGGGGGGEVRDRAKLLKDAVDLATKALGDNRCKRAIEGSLSDDPAALLTKLYSKGNIAPDKEPWGSYTDLRNGGGEYARIHIGEGVWREDLAMQMSLSEKTNDEFIARAIEILHELSHATGKYTHADNIKLSPSTIVKTHPQTNQLIYDACFAPKPPTPSRKRGDE